MSFYSKLAFKVVPHVCPSALLAALVSPFAVQVRAFIVWHCLVMRKPELTALSELDRPLAHLLRSRDLLEFAVIVELLLALAERSTYFARVVVEVELADKLRRDEAAELACVWHSRVGHLLHWSFLQSSSLRFWFSEFEVGLEEVVSALVVALLALVGHHLVASSVKSLQRSALEVGLVSAESVVLTSHASVPTDSVAGPGSLPRDLRLLHLERQRVRYAVDLALEVHLLLEEARVVLHDLDMPLASCVRLQICACVVLWLLHQRV